MKHIEKYILNSWKKVPTDWKNRVKYNMTAGVNASDLPFGIAFNNEEIDKKIQTMVDKLFVKALAEFYHFKEDEAVEMLKEMNNR